MRKSLTMLIFTLLAGPMAAQWEGVNLYGTGTDRRKIMARLTGYTGVWMDNTGAQRAIIGGNAFGGCGVLTLKSGVVLSEVTQVDIRCSGLTLTGTPLTVRNSSAQTRFDVATDGTATLYDTDGSVLSRIDDNVVTLRDFAGAERAVLGGNGLLPDCGVLTLKSGGALFETTQVDLRCSAFTMFNSAGSTRVRITPDIAGSISRMELLSGGTTLVDFQAGASGGSFKIALDATGADGVSGTTGGLLYTHTLNFYNAAGTLPVGINIAGFGRGGAATMALPAALGSDGDCYKLLTAATGQHGYGACGGGGGAVSSVTGGGPITASPTTGAVILDCPTCVTLSGTNTFTAVNTFSSSVNVSAGIGTSFAAKGAFSENVILIDTNGLKGAGVFGTVNWYIDRDGRYHYPPGAAGSQDGYTGLCVGLDNIEFRNGWAVRCFP